MKTAFYTSLMFVLISTLVIKVVGVWTGVPSSELPIEVLKEPRTSFTDEAMRAILEANALRKADSPQLLVLGASAAQEAYRPGDLQPFLTKIQVNNLAIGAANIGEISEVFDHCAKSLPAMLRKDSLVVLGLSYPLFVPDKVRWRHPDFVSPAIVASGIYISDLKRESMRSPLVLDSGNPVFRMLPSQLVSYAKGRAHFWNAFSKKYKSHPADPLLQLQSWQWRLPDQHAGDRSRFPKREAPPVRPWPSPREQMDWLTGYMGTDPGVLMPEQFEVMQKLIHRIRSTGMKVVVVDMPLPSWHRADSPFNLPYRNHLAATLTPFNGDAGVRYVDLSASCPDEDFRDSIHPNAEVRAVWCDRLAAALRPIIDD